MSDGVGPIIYTCRHGLPCMLCLTPSGKRVGNRLSSFANRSCKRQIRLRSDLSGSHLLPSEYPDVYYRTDPLPPHLGWPSRRCAPLQSGWRAADRPECGPSTLSVLICASTIMRVLKMDSLTRCPLAASPLPESQATSASSCRPQRLPDTRAHRRTSDTNCSGQR